MRDPTSETDQAFLPRYRVTGFIGEGAAARIYKVVDRQTGSVRAIKALKPESNAEPSIVKRFEDEYLILRRLHHPSLPEVYDYGFTGDGIRYIVMDFVEGEPLDAYFEGHRGDLWLLLYEMCEVLSFIHDRDLLHLDLKPANILVKRTSAYGDEKPMVVLMDFGLSYRREVGGERSLVGTPEYMAPEIIRGDGRLTRAVDYYSLGITLYQLLTGKTPFRGDIKDVFAGHLREEVRFREEKTEHAELYPHVLGLVCKDVNNRLAAFQDFRRAVTGRLTGGIDELERLYGMSIVASIGNIGRADVWEQIKSWLDTTVSFAGPHYPNSGIESPAAQSLAHVTKDRTNSPLSPPTRSLTNQLLATLNAKVNVKNTAGAYRPPTVLLVEGPPGAGKTHVVNELASSFQLNGWVIRHLNRSSSDGVFAGDVPNGTSFQDSASRRPQIASNPKLLDHFMTAWDGMIHSTYSSGTLVIVDDYDRLDPHQKQFIDYMSRRIKISRSSEEGSRVSVVIAATHPDLAKTLPELFGDDEIEICQLSPSAKTETEQYINQFCSSPLTHEDRSYLEKYLGQFAESPATIIAVLEHLVFNDDLLFRLGTWRFRKPDLNPDTKQSDILREFYHEVAQRLDPKPREVLNWLCCHDGPIPIRDLSKLSRVTTDDIFSSIRTLRGNQIFVHVTTRNDVFVDFNSDSLRQALYESIPEIVQRKIHLAYCRFYAKDLSLHSDVDWERFGFVTDQLVYHYKMLGLYRDMIKTQITAISIYKRRHRFLELRNICESSITTLDVILPHEIRYDLALLRRYYLKRLVESHWILNDFQAIRSLVHRQTARTDGVIPTGVLLKCAVSLVFVADYTLAATMARATKRRYPDQLSEAFLTASIVDATIYTEESNYQLALKLLGEVERNAHRLSEYGRCRLYTSYSLIFERLERGNKLRRYLKLLEHSARTNRFVHEYLIYLSAQFDALFDKLLLKDAKNLVKKGIAIASKNKSYDRLVDWYFRAGAVYYESGSYDRSIRYVQKSLRLTERLGQVEKVPSMETRLAMNYYSAGLYGNALRHIKKALTAWNDRWTPSTGIVIYLFALDVHLTIRSPDTGHYWNLVNGYMSNFDVARRRGYYWYLAGMYYRTMFDMSAALKAFRKSRLIEEESGVLDDAARAGLKEALTMLDLGMYGKAKGMIGQVIQLCRRLESKNIEAELRAVQLAYHYRMRSRPAVLRRYISRCEAAAKDAAEVPILLLAEKIMIRAKARLGDIDDANHEFNKYLHRLKKIVSNMSDKATAAGFLNDDDEKLLFGEHQIINRRAGHEQHAPP